jgi:integrase
VFTREDGTGLHPHQVADAFDAAVRRPTASEKAEGKKISDRPILNFHGLRHTWATVTLQAGVNPKVVSERLGHASVGFTLDQYAHCTPDMQAEAAATFAGLVFGGQQ